MPLKNFNLIRSSGCLIVHYVLHFQFSDVVSCVVMLMVLLFIGPLLRPLPVACLSSIIMVNVRTLFHQFLRLPYFWRMCKYDFVSIMHTNRSYFVCLFIPSPHAAQTVIRLQLNLHQYTICILEKRQGQLSRS